MIALALSAVLHAAPAPSPRKVYADYHVARYTRAHDGAVGLWKYTGLAKTSHVADRQINRNADLVDANGQHELAAAEYPLVGPQSDLDPDFLEYEVLSAKAAGIDGFLVEWGYREHGSERIREALAKVAQRYGFEIGINLCDHWLFSELPARPGLRTRSEYVGAFAENYAYLARDVCAQPEFPRFQGRPVLFLFGGGLTLPEFAQMRQAAGLAAAEEPLVMIRPLIGGGTASGHFHQSWQPSGWYAAGRGFAPGVAGYFDWVPTRGRHPAGGALAAGFDRYGTVEDAVIYLNLVRSRAGSGPGVASATPGFDNRNCGGWGADFSCLPRGRGELYQAMWSDALSHREAVDWVFIPTWNDWTEGSQIEPSVQDGGGYLGLTAQWTARFKGTTADPALLALPQQLFELRQRGRTVGRLGLPVDDSGWRELDAAALAIARGEADAAEAHLAAAERTIRSREAAVPAPRPMSVAGEVNAGRFVLAEAQAALLRDHPWTGVIEFEFRPTGKGALVVRTDSDRARSAVGDFGVVASVDLVAAAGWRRARVELVPASCAWKHRLANGADLTFSGPAEVRGLRLTAAWYPSGEAAR